MIHILYNPLANNRHGNKAIKEISDKFPNEKISVLDITKTEIIGLFKSTPEDDKIILTGGDGTLNNFINSCGDFHIVHTIYYYPSGSGNDFIRDLNEPLENGMVCLNKYIKDLPIVTVNGKSYRFLNGIGFGVDGYCCEESDRLKAKYKMKFNYSLIALKGLLFDYKPTNATIEVDGKIYKYTNVWMAPVMKGKYFGGGVMIAPMQNRLNKEHTVTAITAHCKSVLKLLFIFPSIYKGNHIKYTNVVDFYTGHNITVTFDRPTALQIDGETVRNVLTYTVHTV